MQPFPNKKERPLKTAGSCSHTWTRIGTASSVEDFHNSTRGKEPHDEGPESLLDLLKQLRIVLAED